jgi:Domain of unknown function (DUF1844)
MPEEDVNGTEKNEIDADEREAMQRLQEEIGRLSVADHLLLMLHSLSSLAVDRLGLTPEAATRKDLDQARLAIDAFTALLRVLEGKGPAEEITAHRSVLSQLQVAYVAALGPSRPGTEAPAGGDGGEEVP